MPRAIAETDAGLLPHIFDRCGATALTRCNKLRAVQCGALHRRLLFKLASLETGG